MAIGGVYPTRATAVFISEEGFELTDLYTGTDKTYLLARYRNGALDWQGNVLSDGISESNWELNRRYLTIKASDNLSTLKSYPFTDALGENYGNTGDNIQSFLWAIKEGLKKTGFNMNIWSFVDLKPLVQGIGGSLFTVTLSPPLTSRADYFVFEFDTIAERSVLYDAIDPNDILEFIDGSMEGLKFTVVSKTVTTTRFPYSFRLYVSELIPAHSRQSVTISVAPPSSTVDGEDPLYNTNHDVRVWIKDSNIEGKTYYEARGGAMNTWEVLDAIARQWGVVIQQNKGHWEVRRWNADKLPSNTYEWFVYNSEGTPIGRQPFGSDVSLPCKPTDRAYRIFGTSLKMDRVLKNVIVNYQYKYKQEGDSMKNLVDNPNFEGVTVGSVPQWTIMSILSDSAPMSITPLTTGIPPLDINNAAIIKNYNKYTFLANRSLYKDANPIRQVNRGDRLKISWWEKIDGDRIYKGDEGAILRISIRESYTYVFNSGPDNILYDAVLSGIDRPEVRNVQGASTLYQGYRASWRKKTEAGGDYCFVSVLKERDGIGKGSWRQISLDVEAVPISGFVTLEIIGVGCIPDILPVDIIYQIPVGQRSEKRAYVNSLVANPNDNNKKTLFGDTTALLSLSPVVPDTYELTITGFQFNKIIDANNEAVPQIDPFMYPDFQSQLTREYTDTISDIDVLTGDDYGEYAEDRISGMSWGDNITLFWDTWDNRYGWSRQGLVTAKSVMEMYWKPTTLLQCEINYTGLHWSSRITFEELPGKRFVILNGSIGGDRSTFRGVLKEILDENEDVLPPGGNDGNSTVNPDWQPTGATRCVRDVDGLNTGDVERVETDINQASPTYGQERWAPAGTDTSTCPIGSPPDIAWGEQLTFFANTLRRVPYAKSGDTYTVAFSNDGSNVYLRFLHLASLGTIRSIKYETGATSTTGWEYEPDVIIEGYTYKHIKLSWFVGVITNLVVNFEIN
ncbi:hypothetical protein G5B30_16525 [Sphingobacterium sp. SGG-5]|uniref:hypothetical protein n=1 Tax=Sphingobacterium sp. SGG-5 TaxID=2710881 RepID=UPI0013ECA7E6|nr:hypothetical protein [Sphingobacterium sp. SGG-5]NGM63516.1 hypothetical protein [Sphingobacterium sp. SGG-5]